MKEKKTHLTGLEERERLYKKYGDLLPKAHGYQILCKTYIPPEKTQGGIIMPNNIVDNAVYQTMIGLVLDMGEACYTGDKFKYWGKAVARLGDWVMMPRMEFVMSTFYGWSDEDENRYEKLELRFVFDERIVGAIPDPRHYSEAHILGR